MRPRTNRHSCTMTNAKLTQDTSAEIDRRNSRLIVNYDYVHKQQGSKTERLTHSQNSTTGSTCDLIVSLMNMGDESLGSLNVALSNDSTLLLQPLVRLKSLRHLHRHTHTLRLKLYTVSKRIPPNHQR